MASAGKLRAVALFITLSLVPQAALAWDGTDADGNSVEIESGNLVRPGEDIDVYHSERGLGTYSVENVERSGSTVEVEVYNYDSGEYETFEMED